jgi:16S rRNA (guanine966-N2)-methyltransferase
MLLLILRHNFSRIIYSGSISLEFMSLRVAGNRSLKTLPGLATRPTPAKVRAALFNIWQGDITDSAWLDLCTGSGAIGAEALIRGARRVVGIEQSRPACQLIRQNWSQVAQPKQQFQVHCGSILQKLPGLAGQQFDRIYFDPPYASDLYLPVLQAIGEYGLLAAGGAIAVEFNPKQPPDWSQSYFAPGRIKTYGNTALMFLGAV